MPKWQCISNCGACCHLAPEHRPDLDEYLTPDELELYLSMVGEDGWCINFEPTTRQCRIYADRPRFCRVEADVFKDMYGVETEDLDEFAIDCCFEQIAGVYGERSLEQIRYQQAIGIGF